MTVGVAVVELQVHGCRSLKQKRGVIRSITQRVRNRFNLSVAEVGGQDTWQRATLGFAVVASEARIAEDTVAALDRFLWSHPEIEIVDAHTRWLE